MMEGPVSMSTGNSVRALHSESLGETSVALGFCNADPLRDRKERDATEPRGRAGTPVLLTLAVCTHKSLHLCAPIFSSIKWA